MGGGWGGPCRALRLGRRSPRAVAERDGCGAAARLVTGSSRVGSTRGRRRRAPSAARRGRRGRNGHAGGGGEVRGHLRLVSSSSRLRLLCVLRALLARQLEEVLHVHVDAPSEVGKRSHATPHAEGRQNTGCCWRDRDDTSTAHARVGRRRVVRGLRCENQGQIGRHVQAAKAAGEPREHGRESTQAAHARWRRMAHGGGAPAIGRTSGAASVRQSCAAIGSQVSGKEVRRENARRQAQPGGRQEGPLREAHEEGPQGAGAARLPRRARRHAHTCDSSRVVEREIAVQVRRNRRPPEGPKGGGHGLLRSSAAGALVREAALAQRGRGGGRSLLGVVGRAAAQRVEPVFDRGACAAREQGHHLAPFVANLGHGG
mmetsp:Transcript_7178/g.17717  ORF Transcript_7178/g.17717 Transcript_7178/m.17717 type:complete len:373 (+) Transcript_7178:1568-2686(+)